MRYPSRGGGLFCLALFTRGTKYLYALYVGTPKTKRRSEIIYRVVIGSTCSLEELKPS